MLTSNLQSVPANSKGEGGAITYDQAHSYHSLFVTLPIPEKNSEKTGETPQFPKHIKTAISYICKNCHGYSGVHDSYKSKG